MRLTGPPPQHSMQSMQGPTSHQESGAVGAKLVPEGGEEVEELESLEARGAACEGSIQAGREQEKHKAGQKSYCLQQPETLNMNHLPPCTEFHCRKIHECIS